MAFLRLIRIQNLLIIILTQLLSYHCLVLGNLSTLTRDPKLYLIILGTVLVAAGGYAINDYFDMYADLINKPDKTVAGKVIPVKEILKIWLSFTIIGLVTAYYVSFHIFLFFLLAALLLFLYSKFLKGVPVIGNIAVSLLLAMAILVMNIYGDAFDPNLFYFYSAFAFISGMIREIVKDVEDMKGDRETEKFTFPVRKGLKKTKNLIIVTFALLDIVMLGFGVYLYFVYTIKMVLTFALLVYLPHLIIFIRFLVDYEQEKYSRISLQTKLLTLLGILSMLMFNQNI